MPISLEIENKINTYMNDFETTYNVLANIDDKISKLNQSLAIKEAEQDDLLHEIELANLNVVERSRFYNDLKKVREERRLIKDELQVLKTIKPLADILIRKGVYAEMNQTIQNLDNCKKLFIDRVYHAKVRKNLKCAVEGEKQ